MAIHKQENTLILPARLISCLAQICIVSFVRSGNSASLVLSSCLCVLVANNRNACVGIVLAEDDSLVYVCGSNRDHQEHISTDIFVHCFSRFSFWFQIGGFFCYISKTKMVKKILSLVHALELPEQLFSEARQLISQETELFFSVDLPILEAQRVRDQMVLCLFRASFTRHKQGPGSTFVCILKAFWELWLNKRIEFLVHVSLLGMQKALAVLRSLHLTVAAPQFTKQHSFSTSGS